MRAKLSETPKAYRAKGDVRLKGACPDCGKLIMLRNSDGMIRSHQRASTMLRCPGSGLTPSKAAESIFKANWQAPRRSN